ncbi:MAG: efflux RND transporter periplasmic adaptor subunit [Pseudomonadota bacterium]|nr:efflux RND transporter periplasmic adaptor subunit [Pseudomonadota bacterium]
MANTKSFRFFCLFFMLPALLISFFASPLLAAPSGRKSGPPPLVKVAVISKENVNSPTEYVGHIEAIQYVDLRARVEGFIEEVKFKEGDKVTAGDGLYIIEPAHYKAKVNVCRAQVARAEAILQKNSQQLQRLRAARPESIRATDMDNAIAEELQAKAELEETKANLVRARLDLDYTLIKAPISGRIGRTAYTKGNLVNLSSGPLARIVQLDPIRVVYPVSENDLPAIQTALHDAKKSNGNPLLQPRIRLANGELYQESGRVDFVDNQVDIKTGTISVWARFNNHEELLLPGQYVTALISRKQPNILPVVPQAAVIIDQQGSSVLVVDNQNKVSKRSITTGKATATKWSVLSGLKTGEKVIIQGIQKVKPGQIVRIAGSDRGTP